MWDKEYNRHVILRLRKGVQNPMGAVKRVVEETAEEEERKWEYVAVKKGYECEVCGVLIPKSERETFFETRMCDACNYKIERIPDLP